MQDIGQCGSKIRLQLSKKFPGSDCMFCVVYYTLSAETFCVGSKQQTCLPVQNEVFAGNKIDVIQNQKFVLGRVENIVGKGKNSGYQHFLLFLQCFQKASFSVSLKLVIVWKRIYYRDNLENGESFFHNIDKSHESLVKNSLLFS